MRLDAATKAAREAGAVLKRYFGEALDYREKADRTFVSKADEEAEAVIRRVLLGAFPHDTIVGEEGGTTGTGAARWHVDPLDGTANFMNGIPECAVSIGLEQAGQYVLGVVYDPFHDELFTAETNAGAFLDGKRLATSALPFSRGLHVVDAAFISGPAKLAYVDHLTRAATGLRMCGSNVLQLVGVARGRYLSSYSDTVHSWDIAAGTVIVREAGGAVAEGSPLIAASSAETLAQAIAIAGASSKNVSRPA